MSVPTSRRRLRWSYLGRVPYAEALSMQLARREALRRGEGDEHLLLLEHPHVYTLGRSARRADVLASDAWLAERGVEVVETDRGGQVTYHGPGQLVGYPIVDLSPDRRDVRRYVRDLQRTLVRTLGDLGVEARGDGRAERIGVWVGEAKIASIGVHLSRWLTTHGFALNVAPALEMFDGIVACGLSGVAMTSVERAGGGRPPLAEVARLCARHFGEIFGRELVPAAEAPAGVRGGGAAADGRR